MTKKMRNKKFSRRYRIRRRRKILAAGCIASAMVMAVSIMELTKADVQAEDSNRYKYYTSVEITSGLTLWDLAQTYMTEEYSDWRAYAIEVMDINHMYSTQLTSGNYVVVPYYADAVPEGEMPEVPNNGV